MKEVRIINLAKNVGATSMHWNDLYGTMRRTHPGLAYPSLAVPLRIERLRTLSHYCSGVRRRYFQGGLLQAALFLKRLSKRRASSLIVHVHTPVLAVAIYLARLTGGRFKVLTTQHNNWDTFRLHQKLFLWLLSYASDAYVVCNKQVADSLPATMQKRLYGTDRLHSIPNSVPVDVMRYYAQRRFDRIISRQPKSQDARTLVVAKMSPQKNGIGLLRLIAAIPELGHITWFGDGPMREQLRAECEHLALCRRVAFAGIVSRERVYEALTECDFYITVSLWEGLSVADLEAVAIGCLPLMSDIPQRRYIAEKTGVLLLPGNNIEAWRSEVRRYVALSYEERAQAGAVFSARACSAFSQEEMVKRYVGLYAKTAPLSPLSVTKPNHVGGKAGPL